MKKAGSILVLSSLLLAAGCSSSDDATIESEDSQSSEATEPEGTEATAALPDIDPPLEFGEAHAVPRPSLHQTRDGLLYGAYLVGDNTIQTRVEDTIVSYSLATGETVTEAALDDASVPADAEASSHLETVFAPSEDGMLLVRIFSYVPPVTGSEAARETILVQAFHAEDGSAAWTQELESWNRGVNPFLTVHETDAEHIVLAWGAHNEPTRSHVLDTSTGDSVWTSDEIRAVAAEGEILAAFEAGDDLDRDGDHPAGMLVDLNTDETLWSHEFESGINIESHNFGDGLVKFTADITGQYGDESDEYVVVDAAAGEPVFESTQSAGALFCKFDRESPMVCYDNQGTVFAIDSATGEVLWDDESIGAERELPSQINLLYKGVIYAEYTGGARPPLALDARTSEDLVPELPIDLIEVGPGYALAEGYDDLEQKALLEIHLATG
ncbi:hypothetical protein GCM10029992_10030 [Glycomyces albus]